MAAANGRTAASSSSWSAQPRRTRPPRKTAPSVESGTSTVASSDPSSVSEARPSWPSRRRSSTSSSSPPEGVPASEAVVMRIAGAPRRAAGACSPYANGSRERDELREGAGAERLGVHLARDPARRRVDERRRRRAAVEPVQLDPRPGGPGDPVERDDGDRPSRERRAGGEACGAQRAVGAAVGREEDERVERRAGGLGRTRRRVRAGELDERRGPAPVVVRSRALAVVVSMGNEDDRLVEGARDDGGEVAELGPADTGHVLLPPVLVDGQPVEGELLAEPVRGPPRLERSRHAARVLADEFGGQRGRRRRVERRRKGRRRQRAGAAQGEQREQQRWQEDDRDLAHEAHVDGALDRATPRPPRCRAEAGGLHPEGYSRRGQAITPEASPPPAEMPDPSSTILLVDDEDAIQSLLTYPLERDGYRVVQARDGDEALRRFAEEDVDLVVLDIMLPRVDGLEVCRRLRAESTVPIIMLTARDDELDKVLGLELGADDYITKPFSIREFRSRVRALLRRAATPHLAGRRDEVIDRGDVVVDLPRRTVEVRGEPVQLTFVEFELLALLASAPGRRVHAPAAARADPRKRGLSRAEDDRRPRPAPAREDRARLGRPRAHPHRPRGRVPVPGRRRLRGMKLPGGIRTTTRDRVARDRGRRARRRVPDGRAVARAAPRRPAARRPPARGADDRVLLRPDGLQGSARDRPVRHRGVVPVGRASRGVPGLRPEPGLAPAARGLVVARRIDQQ